MSTSTNILKHNLHIHNVISAMVNVEMKSNVALNVIDCYRLPWQSHLARYHELASESDDDAVDDRYCIVSKHL